MLVFAACQPSNTQDAAQVQHKVDSMANEMIKPEVEKLQKECDDKIMTAAMDSAKVIMEHSKKGTVHHTVKPTTKKADPPKSGTLTTRPGADNNVKADLKNRAGVEQQATQQPKANLKKRAGVDQPQK